MAHRRLYHSTLGLRVIKQRKRKATFQVESLGRREAHNLCGEEGGTLTGIYIYIYI